LGRPGHRAAVLLRVMLLHHLYGLSDPQAEAQLGNRLSFQKFAGLRAGEAVPDETTICRFRQRMICTNVSTRAHPQSRYLQPATAGQSRHRLVIRWPPARRPKGHAIPR
jgi:Transposase domain (DUF772)